MDRLTTEARSANMRAIKQKNTKPEMLVRRLLHNAGYRYRLHRTNLPGSPDLVFAGRRKVIFVHGCFWHGHDCRAGRPPQTRQDFWIPKLARNRERDAAAVKGLRQLGWRVLTVWQCQTKDQRSLLKRLIKFLEGPGRRAGYLRSAVLRRDRRRFEAGGRYKAVLQKQINRERIS